MLAELAQLLLRRRSTPAGCVSVDKPPLALWVQAASAKLFGYSGCSILAARGARGRRRRRAPLPARLARSSGTRRRPRSPRSRSPCRRSRVAVNRDNNPDALLALLLVAAAYVGARAVERAGWLRSSRLRAVVGLAFNTKMLARRSSSCPASALAYLLLAPALVAAAPRRTCGRGCRCSSRSRAPGSRPSTLTPADRALRRQHDGQQRAQPRARLQRPRPRDRPGRGGTSFGGAAAAARRRFLGRARARSASSTTRSATRARWLLPLALVGGLSALDRRRSRAGAGRELGRAASSLGGWFARRRRRSSATRAGSSTRTTSSMLAPATARARRARHRRALARRPARRAVDASSRSPPSLSTAWLQLDLLRRTGYLSRGCRRPRRRGRGRSDRGRSGAGAAAERVRGAAVRRRIAAAAFATASAALLVGSGRVGGDDLHESAVNGVFPGAGPSYVSGLGQGGPGGGLGPRGGVIDGPRRRPRRVHARRAGLRRRTGGGGPAGVVRGDRPHAALAYVQRTAPLRALPASSSRASRRLRRRVIAGEPVAAMGGFTGRETVLTAGYLARLVRERRRPLLPPRRERPVRRPGRLEQRGRLDDRVRVQRGPGERMGREHRLEPGHPVRLRWQGRRDRGRGVSPVLVRQFGRFALVGVGNTAWSWVAYPALLAVGLAPAVAAGAAFAVGALNGYVWNSRWTFQAPGLRLGAPPVRARPARRPGDDLGTGVAARPGGRAVRRVRPRNGVVTMGRSRPTAGGRSPGGRRREAHSRLSACSQSRPRAAWCHGMRQQRKGHRP